MDNTIKINYKDKEIYLIKTAHVSKDSANEVVEFINQYQPTDIVIELDQQRYEAITNPKKWDETDIIDVIKNKRSTIMLVNLILSSYQKRIAKKLDTQSGNEMLYAIKCAKELNANLILGDRNITTTFKRIYQNLNFIEKIKLLFTIIFSIFDDEEISEEQLENLKSNDLLSEALNEISHQFPNVKKVLVDERDTYLTYHIQQAKGNKVVAVIGAAHSIGILEKINENNSIEDLDTIKPKSLFSKCIGWVIPIIILSMIIYSFTISTSLGTNSIISWILYNGTFSAIGALILLAHPLSILVAFIVAPMTSLNPLLAAGWFAGLTEAYIKKPKIKDFENIANDSSSLKGFFQNRLLKILLIVVFVNLASTIATIISGLDIFKSIINNI
ncbi:MAG: TraB/GumN family protein [Erysipelotrichaceae bacterium]